MEMTSSVDRLLAFEQAPTKRAPIVSWRILTAVLAALAMVVILFVIPVPFVVSSPGPTINVLASNEQGVELILRRGNPRNRTSLNPARTRHLRSRGRASYAW